MALIIGIGIFLTSVIGAVFAQLLGEEFKAWAPRLVEAMLRYAIGGLLEDQRDRLDEEWRSHIDEVPGQFGKLFVAFGLIIASRKIGRIGMRVRGFSRATKVVIANIIILPFMKGLVILLIVVISIDIYVWRAKAIFGVRYDAAQIERRREMLKATRDLRLAVAQLGRSAAKR